MDIQTGSKHLASHVVNAGNAVVALDPLEGDPQVLRLPYLVNQTVPSASFHSFIQSRQHALLSTPPHGNAVAVAYILDMLVSNGLAPLR